MKKLICLICMTLILSFGNAASAAVVNSPSGFTFRGYSVNGAPRSTVDNNGVLQNIYKDEYVGFDVNFGENEVYESIGITLGVPAQYAGKNIYVRLDSPQGKEIAVLKTKDTGNWTNYVEQTTELLQNDLSDVHTVYIVFGATGIGNLKYIKFNSSSTSIVPDDITDEQSAKYFEKLYYLGIIDHKKGEEFFPQKIITVSEMLDMVLTDEYKYKREDIVKKFSFDEGAKATYADAACVAVSLLGYDTYMDYFAYEQKDKKSVYYQQAMSADLFAGVEAPSIGKRVTKGMLLAFINNILDSDANDVSKIEPNTGTFYHKDSQKLVYKDYIRKTGIVTGNSYTSIKTGKPLGEGKIEINSKEYSVGEINLDSFLGHNLEFYCDEENDTIYYADTYRTEVLSLSDSEIESGDSSGIRYTIEGKSSAKTAKISDNAYIVYNGQLRTSYTNEIFKPADGDVTLIDYNRNGQYDVVIINDVKPFVIDTITGDVVYAKFTKEQIDLNGSAMFNIKKSSGTAGDIKYLKWLGEGDVLIVGKSVGINGDVLYNINVCKSVDAGTLKQIKNDDKTVYITEKGEYTLADTVYFSDTSTSAKLGDEIKVYLNTNNDVVYVYKISATGYTYGYITKQPLIYDDEDRGEVLRISVFTENGEHLNLFAKDKIKVDTVPCQTPQAAYNAITKSGTQKYTIVRYRTNSEGEIYDIDTPYDNTGSTPSGLGTNEAKNSLHLTAEGNGLVYKSTIKSFSGKIIIDSSTKVFRIPVDNNGIPDMTNKEFFKIGYTGYTNDHTYDLKSYSTDLNSFISEIIVQPIKPTNIGVDKVNSKNSVSFIDKIIVQYDESDDTVKHLISYYQDGAYKSVYMSDKCANSVDIEDFNNGDVVRFSTNDRGEIDNIVEIFDVGTKNIINAESTSFNAENRYSFGTVEKKKGNLFKLAGIDEILNIGAASTYIYDTNSGKVSIGKISDVLSSDTAVTTDKLLVCLRYAEVKAVYIIR